MGTSERQEREKRQRIRLILDTATRLFAKQGYQETSMRDIAREAELGKATLYYYYPTKEAIYQEIFRQCSRQFYQRITTAALQSTTPQTVIADMIDSFLTEAFEQEYFIQLLYPIGRNAPLDLLQDPDISRELDSLRKPLENHLNSVLEQGEWPDDVRLMSSVIWSYLSGLGYKIVMGYPRDSLEAEVSFFVRGLTEYMHKESNHA